MENFALEYWRNKKKRQQIHEELSKQAPKDEARQEGPVVRVHKFSMANDFFAKIKNIGDLASYVGIPAGSSVIRADAIRTRAKRNFGITKKSRKKKQYLLSRASAQTLSNAYILYLFSKGVPRIGQPPRPVLEPAIQAPWNKKEIAALVAKAIDFESKGQHYRAKMALKSAGARAARACREWFEDSRNGWPPNALRTELFKGFNMPGIDTGVMKKAITHIEKPSAGGMVQKVT